MVRTIEFGCDASQTDAIVAHAQQRSGTISISVQRGASVKPPGDVVRIHVHRDEAHELLAWLAQQPGRPATLLLSSPTGVAAPQQEPAMDKQRLDGPWEESIMLLRRETNPRMDYLAIMLLAGAVAAMGLATDTLHLVVAAMVLAPGFQPLVRLPLGLVAGRRTMAVGAWASVASGYGALAVGAVVGWFAVRPITGPVTLGSLRWASYWSEPSATGVLLAVAAGAAGVFSILAQRSVLSAGSMIALALVPSAALVPLGLFNGEWDIVRGAAARWGIDAGVVTAVGFAVLGLKRWTSLRRPAL